VATPSLPVRKRPDGGSSPRSHYADKVRPPRIFLLPSPFLFVSLIFFLPRVCVSSLPLSLSSHFLVFPL
jgi:hypothetical protein